jgi:hypothetical protein
MRRAGRQSYTATIVTFVEREGRMAEEINDLTKVEKRGSRRSRKLSLLIALVGALVATLFVAAVAGAHPIQHGPPDGHLTGSGAFGDIELTGKLDVTNTNDLIADVAVDPKRRICLPRQLGRAGLRGT